MGSVHKVVHDVIFVLRRSVFFFTLRIEFHDSIALDNFTIISKIAQRTVLTVGLDKYNNKNHGEFFIKVSFFDLYSKYNLCLLTHSP